MLSWAGLCYVMLCNDNARHSFARAHWQEPRAFLHYLNDMKALLDIQDDAHKVTIGGRLPYAERNQKTAAAMANSAAPTSSHFSI